MLRISNLKLPVTVEINQHTLKTAVEKVLKTDGVTDIKIIKQSIDARDKSRVSYVLTLDFNVQKQARFLKRKDISISDNKKHYSLPTAVNNGAQPVIVGFGPAGMFCGIALAEMGFKPIIIERGKSVEDRQKDIDEFWKNGKFNSKSNVQFGEGGAGTFSDGKLTTGIKDLRCQYVLEKFVEFGAPKEIAYVAKPHIGTDNLVNVVRNLRNRIIELGGQVLFNHRLIDICNENNKIIVENECGVSIEMPYTHLVLAIGHSSRDTFEMLYNRNFKMEQKPFSTGVRIEHKQEMINKAQYGEFAKYLPAADYKLAVHLPNGRSAYTFCMCPGGVVVAAASEEKRVVTNGMSYFARDGENANSALLIDVQPTDFGSFHPLAGVEFQRKLEEKAFNAGGGNYSAPVQRVGDLLSDTPTTALGKIKPTYKPSVQLSDMRKIFPDFIYSSLKMGIIEMDKKIEGFADSDAIVTAVESRSSSPVRILRDFDTMESLDRKHIYPCGEGCGYAGGIVSAAVDGVKVAEKIALYDL